MMYFRTQQVRSSLPSITVLTRKNNFVLHFLVMCQKAVFQITHTHTYTYCFQCISVFTQTIPHCAVHPRYPDSKQSKNIKCGIQYSNTDGGASSVQLSCPSKKRGVYIQTKKLNSFCSKSQFLMRTWVKQSLLVIVQWCFYTGTVLIHMPPFLLRQHEGVRCLGFHIHFLTTMSPSSGFLQCRQNRPREYTYAIKIVSVSAQQGSSSCLSVCYVEECS